MIYIASPYSHKDHSVMDQRYESVAKFAAVCISLGHKVYSPIAHNHPLAKNYALPRGFDFWLEYDLHILKRCDELYVCKIDGWEESVGVQAEIKFAVENNIPITYFEDLNGPVTYVS